MKLSDELKQLQSKMYDSDFSTLDKLSSLCDKMVSLAEATESLYLYIDSVHNDKTMELIKRAKDLRERFDQEIG